jgi:serine/threonine protein kinase/Flp pilus assembly protein TadD
MTPLNPLRNPVEELADEFLARYRRGERPAISEYTSKYPDLAKDIGELFPALVLMEEAGPRDADRSTPVRGNAPARVGDYRILREIGRGGMGIVYEAEHEALGRHIALKVLPTHTLLDSRHLERFRREARAAARLHHTNIVPVFAVGEQDGLQFYVMQFIHGLGLDEVLSELRRQREAHQKTPVPAYATGSAPQIAESLTTGRFAIPDERMRAEETELKLTRGEISAPSSDARQPSPVPLSPGAVADCEGRRSSTSLPGQEACSTLSDTRSAYWHSVARIGVQVADALAYAHGQGVLHRDIKPSNLLLDTHGTVWVTDFGLAKASDSDDLTHTGDIVGTLRYLAPERLYGRSDVRGDIYSLGATLYELLTLRPVFDESDRSHLMQRLERVEPARPRAVDPSIPRDLETVVLKAITKDPADRYQLAAELAGDLRQFLEDKPIRARRTTWREHAWRWMRRNPGWAATLVMLGLVCSVGFAGISWKWREAQDARDDERQARQDADQRAREVQQMFERLRTSQSLLERGRYFIFSQRWDDAHAAFTKAVELRPENDATWAERAELHAQLGLWDMAAADMARVHELRSPHVSWLWYRHALLRLSQGDVEGYRQACRRMRERFAGTTNDFFAGELVRASVLGPDPDADMLQMIEIVEKMAAAQSGGSWFVRYIRGVAYYRAERYQEAEASLRAIHDIDNKPWAAGLLYPAHAMAQHRLGRQADARRTMEESRRVWGEWTNLRYQWQGGNPAVHRGATATWPFGWWDWLEFQQYHREASLLIDGELPAEDYRLHMLRARSLSALRRAALADVEYSKALRLAPDDPTTRLEVHRNRGHAHVDSRQWREAAAEFSRASELETKNSLLLFDAAVAFLAAEDIDSYRHTCGILMDGFERSDNRDAVLHALWACVLLPDALADMSRLSPPADRISPVWVAGPSGRGAALYRTGRYDEAISCFQGSANTFRPHALDWIFLAMAQHRLGRADEARRALASAQLWIDQADRQNEDSVEGTQPGWGAWTDRIYTTKLFREAEQLIGQ